MTPAELRALPIVIYERRHHHLPQEPTFNELLVLSLALNVDVAHSHKEWAALADDMHIIHKQRDE